MDRRLSVTRSSSSRLAKQHRRRPAPTLLRTDLTNFRTVVQQLTGTPLLPSPPRMPSSRLRWIAPPPLLRARQHSRAAFDHHLQMQNSRDYDLHDGMRLQQQRQPLHLHADVHVFPASPHTALTPALSPPLVSPLLASHVSDREMVYPQFSRMTAQPYSRAPMHEITQEPIEPSLDGFSASLRHLLQSPTPGVQGLLPPPRLENAQLPFLPSPSFLHPLSPFSTACSPSAPFPWLPPWLPPPYLSPPPISPSLFPHSPAASFGRQPRPHP